LAATQPQYAFTVDSSFVATISCNGNEVDLVGKTLVQANVWYHVAATYNGSIFILYVNGVEDARTSVTGALSVNSDSLFIGEAPFLGGGYGCVGMIDEVRISSTARAASALQIYLPSAVTQIATIDLKPNIRLHGIANPHGLDTKIYFEWDTTPAMSHPTQTALQPIGGANADTNVSAVIPAIVPNTYYFRLVAVTPEGSTQGSIQFYSTVSGVDENWSEPESSLLENNYPNPFSSSTSFGVNLPTQNLMHATLNVYDIYGKVVANLTGAMRSNPNQIILSADNLPAGKYWYVFDSPMSRLVRDMIVVK